MFADIVGSSGRGLLTDDVTHKLANEPTDNVVAHVPSNKVTRDAEVFIDCLIGKIFLIDRADCAVKLSPQLLWTAVS